MKSSLDHRIWCQICWGLEHIYRFSASSGKTLEMFLGLGVAGGWYRLMSPPNKIRQLGYDFSVYISILQSKGLFKTLSNCCSKYSAKIKGRICSGDVVPYSFVWIRMNPCKSDSGQLGCSKVFQRLQANPSRSQVWRPETEMDGELHVLFICYSHVLNAKSAMTYYDFIVIGCFWSMVQK